MTTDALRPPGRLAICATIALGSALGGVLRLLAVDALALAVPASVPLGTLFVNFTGSFLIGLYARWISARMADRTDPRQRHFVMTGLCGGYTTFSAFSLETLHRLQAGAWAGAALDVVIAATTWLAGAWLGFALAARLDPRKA